MKIVEMNEGTKIAYALDGNYLVLGDDELRLNLEKYERDDVNTIDVCMDEHNNLVTSTAGKRGAYVAQVIIPAKEYAPADAEKAQAAAQAVAARLAAGEDATEENEGAGGMEDDAMRLEPVPFDTARCEMALWAQI